MNLDLSGLKKAAASLSKAINVYEESARKNMHEDLLDTLKAGVIQNFEFTYELSWKFMKRWIENNISATSVDGVTRRELFRLAAESKLIYDVELWMDFHGKRNISSHTYDEKNADSVFSITQDFLIEVAALLKVLEEKNS